MRRIMIACGILACQALTAHAGARENAIDHIAQVMAGTAVCDKVEANEDVLSALAAFYGINSKKDQKEIMAKTREKIDSLESRNVEAVCLATLFLYGPNGQNVKNLVREK